MIVLERDVEKLTVGTGDRFGRPRRASDACSNR